MRLMDVSALMLEPQEGLTVADVVGMAKQAEALGFPRMFRSDHLLPTSGRRGIPSAECWVSLAAVAATTTRLVFGPLVSPIGFRHPTLLAKMAYDLHVYSGGRLVLGVGAGWYQSEFECYGLDFPPTAERIRRLEEALTVIRGLVDGQKVDFKGKYYSCSLELHPKTSTRMWLIVGARNRKTVSVAARHADEWNFFAMGPDQYRELRRVFDSERKREIRVSMMTPFIISQDRRDLERRIAEFAKRRGLGSDTEAAKRKIADGFGIPVGTPEEAADQLRRWMDMGVQAFMFQLVDISDRGLLDSLVETLRQSG